MSTVWQLSLTGNLGMLKSLLQHTKLRQCCEIWQEIQLLVRLNTPGEQLPSKHSEHCFQQCSAPRLSPATVYKELFDKWHTVAMTSLNTFILECPTVTWYSGDFEHQKFHWEEKTFKWSLGKESEGAYCQCEKGQVRLRSSTVMSHSLWLKKYCHDLRRAIRNSLPVTVV